MQEHAEKKNITKMILKKQEIITGWAGNIKIFGFVWLTGL